MENTNTGTLIPPTDFQRGIPSPVRAPDSGPGVYSTTVNMLHEARDVLYPQNPQNFQNMQFYPVPAMVNYGTSELSRHSIQYTPGVGQYPVLHSSVNKGVITTNTTDIPTSTVVSVTGNSFANPMTSADILPPQGRTYRNPDSKAAPSENQQYQQDPSDVDKAPAWFSKTMHQFNTKLQQIERKRKVATF